MDQGDLASSLYYDQVDPEELVQVALETLGAGVYESPDEFICHRPGLPPALHFKFKGKKLRTITAGPGLSNDDIHSIQSRIRTEILNPERTIAGRMILFSAFPVTGYLRAGNSLQICPVPSHAPKPKDPQEGDHPFLIEFLVNDSPNLSIRINRIYSAAQKLALFLGAISEGVITAPSTSNHFRWVTRNDPKSQYEHALEGYGYADFERHQEGFTEYGSMSHIEYVDDRKYFERMGFDSGRSLQLPNSFEQLLNIFLQLNPALQDKFCRAAYWYSLAQSQESSSARFLHLIQSIESLLPPAEARSICPTCEKERGDGPTQRFKEFLEKLVPAHPELAQTRNQLYRLRSNLSHGWDIFGRDFGRNYIPSSAEQTMKIFEAYQLARVGLINWLIMQGPQMNASSQASTVISLV